MKYICKTLDFKIEEPTVISLGKFDGLHRGHELLIRRMKEIGEERGRKTAAFTFDIPPKSQVLNVEPKTLTTNEEKLHIFEKAGVDYLVECPFTDEVRTMPAEEFVRWLVRALNVRDIVVGTDFCFGYNRQGDYRLLQRMEKEYGYRTSVVEKLKENGVDISSSYIRETLAQGDLIKANRMLGYPFFLQGKVEHGKALGRTIGFPTLNLLPPADKLLPPKGVYLTRVTIDGQAYCGVTNVGVRPTVSDSGIVTVETHALDFSEEMYAQTICVEFLSFLRDEKKFDNVAQLKSQMQNDITAVRQKYERYYKDITKMIDSDGECCYTVLG